MSVDSQDLWRFTLFINYGKYGWSETFDLFTGTTDDMATKANRITAYRMRMIPQQLTAVYGRLSQKGSPRNSLSVLKTAHVGSFNVEVAPAVSKVNDPGSCLKVRVQGENFAYAIRLMRGIADTEITDTLWASEGSNPALMVANPDTFAPVDAPAAAADFLTAFQEFNTVLYQYTCLPKRVTITNQDGTTSQVWRQNNIQSFLYRGVGHKNVGRPFGLSVGRVTVR